MRSSSKVDRDRQSQPDPDASAPLLAVEDVSKEFQGEPRPIQALQPISFEVAPAEFICIVGASGSGKSTLLRIIGGLLPPTAGAVKLRGEALTEPHADIGFVFQKTNLMPWRTTLENVLLPLELQGETGPDARRQGQEMLALVGLEEFAEAYPKQLSGGMNQRVVLARALLQQPQLLLLDEPFGALDALTRERLNLELLRLRRIQQQTVLMVTHSISEAVFLADQVLVLGGQPGQLVAQVPIDLPRPRRLDIMGEEHFGRLTTQIRHHIGVLEETETGG